MNEIGIAFTLINSLLLLILPRRWAAIPLLMGAAYMTRGQEFEIGPAHLSVLRMLILVGFVRVLVNREHLANGMLAIDRWVILWAVILVGTSAFHTPDAWIFRVGTVWSDLGCYFLFRIFMSDWEDVVRIFKITCVILVPVAILMLIEKETQSNLFGALGGVNPIASMRDGNIRAGGPFAHAILAGTVGATCLPMAIYLWRLHRQQAVLGLFAAVGMVFACTSSGPILMVGFIVGAMALWKLRDQIGHIRWLSALVILALAAVMNDPVYFLVARIDITGGSQGYFRAQLIRSSIEHFDEWRLIGTDYTRHWMATGLSASSNHTDITNHILAMGVMGGLPLMLAFVMILVAAFHAVGHAIQKSSQAPLEQVFLAWTLGSILFGHVMNFMSISLFDQSVVFFYLVLAAIGSIQVTRTSVAADFVRSRNGHPIRRKSTHATPGNNVHEPIAH